MDDIVEADEKAAQSAMHDRRLGFMIYRAGLAIARGYERVLKPINVVPVEAGVLGSLCYEGPNHVRGLARQLGVGRQTIVNVTKSLEAKNWINRSVSPGDARLVVFSITQLGRTKMHEIEVLAVEFDVRLREIVGNSHEQNLIEHMRDIVGSPLLGYDA